MLLSYNKRIVLLQKATESKILDQTINFFYFNDQVRVHKMSSKLWRCWKSIIIYRCYVKKVVCFLESSPSVNHLLNFFRFFIHLPHTIYICIYISTRFLSTALHSRILSNLIFFFFIVSARVIYFPHFEKLNFEISFSVLFVTSSCFLVRLHSSNHRSVSFLSSCIY